jgi:DNA-binding response OmpR family regulator
LRRPENITTNSKIRFKNLSFDTVTKKVKIDGQEIPLTRNESLMLEIFLEKPGAVIDRERLVCGVWGTHRAAEVSDNNLSATLSNLRRKLGPGFSIKPLYNQGLSLE